MSTTNSEGKPRSNTYAKACPKHTKNKTKQNKNLSQLQYIFNIDTRKLFNNVHVKPHKDHASVVWDGCGEVHLKQLSSLHRREDKLILPDPSLSTEQKISALGTLNLPQQLAYNKGIFMHKVLNNYSPNYLAQLFNFSSPTILTPGITSTCQGQGLTYLKLAYTSLDRSSGIPCLEI